VKGPHQLRAIDLLGKPIVSELPYELLSDGALSQMDISLTRADMFINLAGSATFSECLTGCVYPVGQEEGYIGPERADVEARSAPGKSLLVMLMAL
jgi:uncharacterized lipoprotein NlpE involved in copper resistance